MTLAGRVTHRPASWGASGGHPKARRAAFLPPPSWRVSSGVLYEGLDVLLGCSTEVTVAGLGIRRQRPLRRAVFITLDDEVDNIPLVAWPDVHGQYRQGARGTASSGSCRGLPLSGNAERGAGPR